MAPWDEDRFKFQKPSHTQCYKTIRKREHVPCRYFHSENLDNLNMLNDVFAIVRVMHIEKLITIDTPSYKELSEEFLSSLDIHRSKKDRHPMSMTFRIDKKWYNMTLHEVNALFGFDDNGLRAPLNDYKPKEIWKELAIDELPYEARRSKESRLKSFPLRYINRLLNRTILANDSTDCNVGRPNLMALYYATIGMPMNLGMFFMDHLYDVTIRPSSSTIAIGGMITFIAIHHCRINKSILKKYTKLHGIQYLDEKSLRRMKILKKRGNDFFTVNPDGDARVAKRRRVEGQQEQDEGGDDDDDNDDEEDEDIDRMLEEAAAEVEALRAGSSSAPPPHPFASTSFDAPPP